MRWVLGLLVKASKHEASGPGPTSTGTRKSTSWTRLGARSPGLVLSNHCIVLSPCTLAAILTGSLRPLLSVRHARAEAGRGQALPPHPAPSLCAPSAAEAFLLLLAHHRLLLAAPVRVRVCARGTRGRAERRSFHMSKPLSWTSDLTSSSRGAGTNS